MWEPVLPTDLGAPSTVTLKRLYDLRVFQYWDKEHLVSHLLGERDHASVVWDYVAVYAPGQLWDYAPPKPVSSGGPVVHAISNTKDQMQHLLQQLAVASRLP